MTVSHYFAFAKVGHLLVHCLQFGFRHVLRFTPVVMLKSLTTICKHAPVMRHRQLFMSDGIPAHLQDKAQLLHFYPYLEKPFNYDCSDDEWDQQFPEFSPGTNQRGCQ